MKLNQTSSEGFTLIELMVIIAVLAVLTMFLWPAHTGNKAKAGDITCVNNLKQLGFAYHQWANVHSASFPTEVSITNGGALETVLSGDVVSVFHVLTNHLDTPKILHCPTDKRRVQATTFVLTLPKPNRRSVPLNNSNVSYFVGLDATPSASQMFLIGDDHLLVGGQAGSYGGVNGHPVKPGVLSLWTNNPVAWADSRHGKRGKVGLADGSVQGYSSSKLTEALRHTGVPTNRFVFP